MYAAWCATSGTATAAARYLTRWMMLNKSSFATIATIATIALYMYYNNILYNSIYNIHKAIVAKVAEVAIVVLAGG